MSQVVLRAFALFVDAEYQGMPHLTAEDIWGYDESQLTTNGEKLHGLPVHYDVMIRARMGSFIFVCHGMGRGSLPRLSRTADFGNSQKARLETPAVAVTHEHTPFTCIASASPLSIVAVLPPPRAPRLLV